MDQHHRRPLAGAAVDHRVAVQVDLVGLEAHDAGAGPQDTCSIEVARPSSPASTSTAFSHGSSSEVWNWVGTMVRKRCSACSRRHAYHAAPRARHAHVGHVGGPAGQNAGVGGGHVGVRAHAGGHAAVEVPAHRDLLAGGLGVEVHQHVVGLVAQAGQDGVGLGEGGAGGLDEHGPGEVDDTEARSRRAPPPGGRGPGAARGKFAGRTIGRVGVQVAEDLLVAVGVVAEGDRVHAGAEQLAGGLLGDAHPAGDVLAVGDHEVGPVLLAQRGQQAGQGAAAEARPPRRPRTGASPRCQSANLRSRWCSPPRG